MAHFLKTVSATFAAGMVCGAGALIALAPAPVRDVPQADQGQPEKASTPPVAVVNQTSVPCKEQVWPNIDRRCMRWTAERWTGKSGGNSDGAETQPPVNLETAGAPAPETRAAAKPAAPPASAQAKATPQPAAQPDSRRADTPKAVAPAQPAQPAPEPAAQTEPAQQQQTASPAAGDATAKSSHQAEQRKKSSSKARVARSRDRDGERRDARDNRDARDYRDSRDYYGRDYREGRRVARAWGDDNESDFFNTRRVIIRQPAREGSFFLFGN